MGLSGAHQSRAIGPQWEESHAVQVRHAVKKASVGALQRLERDALPDRKAAFSAAILALNG